MARKILVGEIEYDFDNLNEDCQKIFQSMEFTLNRINELNNIHSLFQKAKDAYILTLKQELIREKAGFFIEDD